LSSGPATDVVTIALAVGDTLLAERIVALLGDVAGIRLVTQGEFADATLFATQDVAGARIAAQTDATAIDPDPYLTPRERDVLALLAEGASNKTIARRLGISVHTAKFHVASLLDKLDATGRTDAVTHAARLGVIDL
jgi:DNA-binding CsgD family transcriptional regulator